MHTIALIFVTCACVPAYLSVGLTSLERDPKLSSVVIRCTLLVANILLYIGIKLGS